MKNILAFLLFIFIIVALYGFAFTTPVLDEPTGKTIFTNSKCNTCHSVQSQNITTKKQNPVDLSQTGKNKTTELFTKYLKKLEKINNKNHPALWKGTDPELETLTKWLVTLK
jgi:hypothetical protein